MKDLSVGVAHRCVLKNDGSVFCHDNYHEFKKINGLKNIQMISVGYFLGSCALKNDGNVFCWHYEGITRINALEDIKAISIPYDPSILFYALRSDGNVFVVVRHDVEEYELKRISSLEKIALKDDGSVFWG